MKNIAKTLFSWVCFLVYIAVLIYFVFFAEAMGRTTGSSYGYRYNLVPFKEIVRFVNNAKTLGVMAAVVNILGNVIAFLPFGYFLPMLANNRIKAFKVFAFTFGLSLGIELVQLVCMVGSFDVDDLMLNTLGGIIGYIIYYLRRRVR